MTSQLDIFRSAISDTQDQLMKLHNLLNEFDFPPSKHIKFDASDIDIENICGQIPVGCSGEDYIYIFKVQTDDKISHLFIEFLETERKKQSDLKHKKDLPRVNYENVGSSYLYVGRSQNLRSRIRQHLSEKYKGTYAMHMERWSCELKVLVEIEYFKLTGYESFVIQAIEDSLWSKLKPVFGRRGDK
ncbi:GIY-YIG nuclease family protein [Vibrio natriegens]